MPIKHNLTMFKSRLQSLIRDRSSKKQPREMEISAPFDMKHEPVNLPGVSQEEIAILREKAAASRIGVLELRPESPSYSEYHMRPRPSPRLRPARSADETRVKVAETRPLWA